MQTEPTPLLEDADARELPRQLALGPPARNSEHMDQLAVAGAFNTRPVTFVDAAGVETIVEPKQPIAGLKPVQVGRPDYDADQPDDPSA